MNKKIISMAAALTLAFNYTGFAFASKAVHILMTQQESRRTANDLFYHDFTEDTVGAIPSGFAIAKNSCDVYIEQAYVDEGTLKNCMVMDDFQFNSNSEFLGPYVYKFFEPQGGIIAAELRYKLVHRSTDIVPIQIALGTGENNSAVRFYTDTDSGLWNFENVSFGAAGTIPEDQWITLRIVADSNEGKADISIQADFLKKAGFKTGGALTFDKEAGKITYVGVNFRSTYTEETISTLAFFQGKWEGKVYFDYIKVEKNAERLGAKVEDAIKPPYFTPVLDLPSGKNININYGGKYYFPKNKPVVLYDRNYLEKSDFAILGVNITDNENEILFERNGKIITFNKKDLTVDDIEGRRGIFKDNKYYIMAAPVLTGLGFSLDWNDNTKTIFVTEKESE